MNVTLAVNAALRRCRGRFLAVMPCDILMPAPAFKQLVLLLEGKLRTTFDPQRCFLRVPRCIIPREYYENLHSYTQLDRYFERCRHWLTTDFATYGAYGNAGVLLASREVWHALRAHNEEYRKWGLADTELMLRAEKQFGNAELSAFGICVFDPQPAGQHAKKKLKNMNPALPISFADAGNENWGIPQEEFCEGRGTQTAEAERPEAPVSTYLKVTGTEAPFRFSWTGRLRFLPWIPPFLRFLSTLGKLRWAGRCVEYYDGMRTCFPLLSRMNPALEYQVVLPESREAPASTDFPRIGRFYQHIKFPRHKNQLTFLAGPIATAHSGMADVDLLLVRLSTLRQYRIAVAELLPVLSGRGCLIVHGTPEEIRNAEQAGEFADVAQRLRVLADAGFVVATGPELAEHAERLCVDPQAGESWLGGNVLSRLACRWFLNRTAYTAGEERLLSLSWHFNRLYIRYAQRLRDTLNESG